MCHEQETGGQRKDLPLVRWHGFTDEWFRHVVETKKIPLEVKNETKQSVKSCLKSHAKYWMPQACIYLVLRSTAR